MTICRRAVEIRQSVTLVTLPLIMAHLVRKLRMLVASQRGHRDVGRLIVTSACGDGLATTVARPALSNWRAPPEYGSDSNLDFKFFNGKKQFTKTIRSLLPAKHRQRKGIGHVHFAVVLGSRLAAAH